MDDNAPQGNPPENPAENLPAKPAEPLPENTAEGSPEKPAGNLPADFNKIDLSQLQGFSFGTQWSVDKPLPGEGRERPRREDRRQGLGGGAPDRRDRRPFRRPAGQPGGGAPAGGGERREFSGERRPYRDGGEHRGGPRRDDRREGPAGGEYRGGPRRSFHGGYGGRGEPFERGPYDSPYFSVTFYPEDTSFNTLVQTIRKSCRTIELFEIARTVVAKTDRFVVVVGRKTPAEVTAPAAEGAAQPPAPKPPRQPLYVSLPDGLPFETEEAAVAHVVSHHLGKFFEMEEVEVEPPKGNFQVINKCGVTGELLGPPNYHRYNQIVQQHHATRLPRMPLEAFRVRIETVRDPEAVAQWLAKMRKTTRYTWRPPAPKPPKGPADTAAPTPESAPAEAVNPPAIEVSASAPSAEVKLPAPSFDTLEEARLYLLTHARDRIVRAVEHARFHGKFAEALPPGEIRRAIEGALERQRKFPLDTANALRGRLRREHFTIFKKGSRGISYVCAVKRKFRVPGQTFAESIGALIAFVEAHPMIRASELPAKLLGINLPVPPTAPAPGTPAAEGAPPAPAPALPELTVEERAKISRLQGDLLWLVREGYVTEFIDGALYAPPPMVEARKQEIEAAEHDPENFPEARPPVEGVAPAVESAPEAPPAEAPATEAAVAKADVPPVPAAETQSAPDAGTVPEPVTEAPPAEAPAAPTSETPAGEPVASKSETPAGDAPPAAAESAPTPAVEPEAKPPGE